MANRIMTDPLLDIVIVLLIFTMVRTVSLSMRISRLTQGADGKSLETTIATLSERVTALEAHAKKTEIALNNLDDRMEGAVRGVSVTHYDPFQSAGGQQSFSTTLLNEAGDGVLVSGIHARDSVRVYAKPIKNFTSDRDLSDDERHAIESAKQKLK